LSEIGAEFENGENGQIDI